MDTFKLGFENHHSSWKVHRYDWLPVIPKELGQSVPESHLKILQVCNLIIFLNYTLKCNRANTLFIL